jgi:hypothetical protein
LSSHPPADPSATVATWDARRRESERRCGYLRLGAAGALFVIGLALLGGWLPVDRNWAGMGVLLLFCGLLTILLPVVAEDLRRHRSRRAPSLPVGSPPANDGLLVLSDLQFPASIESFLRSIASLDAARWKSVVAAAADMGLLDRPISSPFLCIDPYYTASMRAGHDPDSFRGVRAFAKNEQALQEAEVLLRRTVEAWDQFEQGREAVDRFVHARVLPFAPPYAEYRLALAGVHALIAAEFLPENCQRALSPFTEVLHADFIDVHCGG